MAFIIIGTIVCKMRNCPVTLHFYIPNFPNILKNKVGGFCCLGGFLFVGFCIDLVFFSKITYYCGTSDAQQKAFTISTAFKRSYTILSKSPPLFQRYSLTDDVVHCNKKLLPPSPHLQVNKTKWKENKTNLKEEVNMHTYKTTCVLRRDETVTPLTAEIKSTEIQISLHI